MIDRQFDQLGKVLVCVSAVTIRHRGRATRSIDHNTHGHRLGQDQALLDKIFFPFQKEREEF